MKKHYNKIFFSIFVIAWLILTVVNAVAPDTEFSESERRKLATLPKFSIDTLLNGNYARGLDTYTTDQFVFREGFRKTQAVFHYYLLNQKDINGIYLNDGYAVKMEYPYKSDSMTYALEKFNGLYEKYLKATGSKIYMTVAPDKNYYMAESSGHLSLDYSAMFADLQAGSPWATFIDLTDTLSLEDYYRTDTHWRQECLIPAAQKLSQAMGNNGPKESDFTATALERPFYGVYYGQAALPMKSETMYILESDVLSNCTVYNHETGKITGVYDEEKIDAKDMYDIFLSGAQSLLTVTNPNATSDKELIVFRDSFGSSMIPLLLQDYKTVTLVDIRYLMSDNVGKFVDFHGQDVLFLYSTLVLNDSSFLK